MKYKDEEKYHDYCNLKKNILAQEQKDSRWGCLNPRMSDPQSIAITTRPHS